MDKQSFIEKTPYLYHLTDKRNLPLIKEQRTLYSTAEIIALSGLENGDEFLRIRRPEHSIVNVNGKSVYIRDQRPLNKALENCLTHSWKPAQFIYHLNSRVFMWPNLKRLWTHYGRYVNENPIIFRFDTSVILELNDQAELSDINSGATRPSGALGGKAAARGKNTFKKIEDCDYRIGKVAEVTFPGFCVLPANFKIGNTPEGRWRETCLN
jgi:hypothetical protein